MFAVEIFIKIDVGKMAERICRAAPCQYGVGLARNRIAQVNCPPCQQGRVVTLASEHGA